MSLQVIDTNVIARFLVKDQMNHFNQAKKIFEEGENGKRNLVILAPVVAETAFVLQSFYKLEAMAIARQLQVLVSQRWIEIQDRAVLNAALEEYGRGMHFIDAYLYAWSRHYEAKLLTFDKKLGNKK